MNNYLTRSGKVNRCSGRIPGWLIRRTSRLLPQMWRLPEPVSNASLPGSCSAFRKRLLPAALFSGAIFLLLADLTARTLLSPIELPIGVVTSIVGAIAFVIIFYRTRKAR